MSCTLNRSIVALTGLPADRIAMTVDATRPHAKHAPVPAPAVVDAVLQQRSGHDREAVTTALRQQFAGLTQLRQQRLADARALDPLMTVLAGRPLAGMAPAVPVVAACIWTRLGIAAPDDPPLAPLPVVLPDGPKARQRVVRAAARFAPWTDEEASQRERYPELAGLAWALGVDHPRIRTLVAQFLDAAITAVRAGAVAPQLITRVITDPTLNAVQAA